MDESVIRSAQNFLYQQEAQNALILGLWDTTKNDGLIPFYDSAQKLSFIALFTEKPYSNLLFSHGRPQSTEQILEQLQKLSIKPKGVIGPLETVKPFVEMWNQKNSQSARIVMEQMLYEMTVLIPPQSVVGYSRIAEQKDFDLLTEWNLAFRQESLPYEPLNREESKKSAQAAIDNRDTYLWCNGDKNNEMVVSSAQIARPTIHTMCVRFVYTPPEARGNGYASAVTAAASQAIFDLGKKSCVLYTDAKNPTSNKIYQKLGYKWVTNSIYYQFYPTSS